MPQNNLKQILSLEDFLLTKCNTLDKQQETQIKQYIHSHDKQVLEAVREEILKHSYWSDGDNEDLEDGPEVVSVEDVVNIINKVLEI